MRTWMVVCVSAMFIVACGNKENAKPGPEGQKAQTAVKGVEAKKVEAAAPAPEAEKAPAAEAGKGEAAPAPESKPAAEAPAEQKAPAEKAEQPAEAKPATDKVPAEAKPAAEVKPAADAPKGDGEKAPVQEVKPVSANQPAAVPSGAVPAATQPAAVLPVRDMRIASADAVPGIAMMLPTMVAGTKAAGAPAPVVAAGPAPAPSPSGQKLPAGASMSANGDYNPPPFQNLDDKPEDQKAREAMVKRLKGSPRHNDPKIIKAMAAVPRHMYMLAKDRKDGYTQNWFRIGHGQTITDPAAVARMTQLLAIKPSDKVLEIGTGSGYQGSLLAQLTPNVYTIEIVEPLAQRTHALLEKLGYKEAIHTKIGDGYYGWEEYAPFDKIIVTCAADHIPIPLLQQLKPGGLMLIPVGPRYQPGKLYFIAKDADGKVHRKVLSNVKFVPMTKLSDWGKEDPRAEERKKMDKEGRKQLNSGE